MSATLEKSAILRGRGAFTNLFTKGKSVSAGAIRCFYLIVESGGTTIRAGFSVTRNIKNATTRNRVKRLMRESWRQRQDGVRKRSAGLQIAFLYTKADEKKELRFSHIDGMMLKIIEKLNQTKL